MKKLEYFDEYIDCIRKLQRIQDSIMPHHKASKLDQWDIDSFHWYQKIWASEEFMAY